MGGSQEAHQSVFGSGGPHESSWTHELIGGAAGFEAMRAYEKHVASTGEQVSHPLMKEMLAGIAAAEVDKLFETKGLDFLDREEAKRRAVSQAHQLADEKYGQGGTYIHEEHHRHHHHHSEQ
ncbi:unnamed protein product [Adineta steineri]|uniref:CipC-like antibiotic response protein n=1 Tax=Adineta steineri TaxID=433720 RepID=A0A815PS09_9BILA|nr:unnamed protein product [Adineta steineri]